MAEKKYTKLPVTHQTPVIKNFFDTTVEQLFSKANIESVSAYIGKKDEDLFTATDTYILQPTADRDKFSLEPVVNSIDQETGLNTNLMFYEDYINVLKSYGVDTKNQNTLFDTQAYSFMPPINVDKFINYQEYFWSPAGPTPVIVSGTSTNPINIEKDILGKKSYTTPQGTVLKNGMVVTFSGNYVIPTRFKDDKRFIVEGVGEGIILHNKEQNFATVFSTEDYIPYDQTIIDPNNDTLINDTKFLSGGLVGVTNYISTDGTWPTPDYTEDQVDATTRQKLWDGYVAPVGSFLRYVAGGVGAFDTMPYDSDNTQENTDYIVMQRASKDNNVWSRINFWHHKQNFLDVGDQLPAKDKRAIRPIVEFDRDIELYNFGTLGKFAVEISAEGSNKSEVLGRPNGSTIDDVTLQVGNLIMFPGEETNVAQHVYLIGTDGSENVTLTRKPADNNPAGAVDGDSNFVPYTAAVGDVITVKFGARYTGIEYYWSGIDWKKGQQKSKINTPIKFNLYDKNKVALDNDSTYPSSTFVGNEIFGYTKATTNTTEDPVLGFPLEYKNFNNFSEISFTNYIDDYFYSYVPFGGTAKSQIQGYLYYKKIEQNGDITFDTAWRPLKEDLKQKVEDRYVIKDADVSNEKTLFHISAVPKNSDSNELGLVEKSIRVYVNGVRKTDFSYDASQVAIKFASFTFSKLDIIDIFTETVTGFVESSKTNGRYNVAKSWHSNLDNVDLLTVSQPEYLEHFKNFVENQEDITGDPLGGNNFDNISKDLKYADTLIQSDDDLQLSAFLFSNDKFNIKDSIDFCAEEYVKYKNRLKKEIVKFVDNNDYSNMSYGEMLELVLENVIAFNQGKNVFNDTFMAAFGDQYIEEKIVINNVLKKEYTLTNYLDLDKVENTIFVYDHDANNIEKILCVDVDYSISSANGVVTITFDPSYVLTLGNTIKVRLYDTNRESTQTPPTPSVLGLYPLYYPEIINDTSFVEPIQMVRGHDGSKSVAVGDVHDYILLEFEKRVYNSTLQQFRNNDSLPDLNVTDIRPGRFRNTGRSRDEFYGLLRNNFNFYITRNEVDFVKNEFYQADNLFTWNYNYGTEKPAHWRGIYESCYDTERPHTHPWEMLGFVRKPSWWETQYGTDYSYPTNKAMWKDLEEGIIRQGNRENVTNDRYKENNPYRRIGLKFEIPVDASGNLLAPANIISTASTTKTITWVETTSGTASASANTFIITDGLSVSEVGSNINITTNNIINHTTGTFPTTDNTNFIEDKELKYKVSLKPAQYNPANSSYANATTTGSSVKGIAVNGALITNANTGITHSDSTSWHYNALYRNEVSRDSKGGAPDSNNIYGYVQPSANVTGVTGYSSTEHSPIIGWALDGFPIYGPYGYEDRGNVLTNIVRIESGYSLKTVDRDTIATGPGGLPTGEFIEDYEYSSNSHGLDQYNGRYGPTPEFPNGTYYYVATINADQTPAYPYTVGPSFADTPVDVTTNATGTTTLDTGTATYNLTSTLTTTYSANSSLTNKDWKYSDGAPVENAWKISEGYPFAVVQSLLLAKPGKFASVFADPRKIVRSSANTNHLLDKDTGRRLKSKNVKIHGEVNGNDVTTYTVGYTQFIDCFLRFQGLNTTGEFVRPFRSVNSKLGHKFGGYVDKDTMTVFSDSYSSTGNSSSLILPQEDIQVDVHVGPYSTTNDFTGVLITLTEDKKYKVEGYNSVKRFFEIEESNKVNGRLTEVSVGGEPADYANFDNTANYQQGTIVKSGFNFFQALKFAGKGVSVTDTTTWQRLSSLPMVNAAEATLYLDGTGKTLKVEYGTVYDTVNELFDFLISLGRKQSSMGYDFGEFNSEINDVNDWLYSGRQMLFWSIGNWSPGNTINLSPAAGGIKFSSKMGRVSKIIDVDQSQYSILDEEGKNIKATECEIIRDGQNLEIRPPEGKQIYGLILYTNEIEHAMTVSNKTIFGDTIYNDVLNQRQRRLKIKGKRTKNWNGTLTAEGYVITTDGLKPNFDTLAGDMGKYNEIGHVPVEKQVYEASRRQYGYNERKYLREFELTQDDQYDFYVGMIRSKGTKNSLEVLLNSEKVLVPGSVNVYDEWALKSGDFGDVDNFQTIDMKITDSEITNERQLIQIAYPEDTVSKVKEVEVLDRTTKFYQRPFLEIEPPPAEIPGSFEYGGGTTAQATVNIGADGRISDVTVTEPGYGYTINPSVTVIAAQLLTANITTQFLKPYAVSTSNVDVSALASASNILITDHFSANTNTEIDLSNVSTTEDVVTAINTTAGVNANIVASSVRTIAGNVESFYLTIKGDDFTLAESGAGNTLANVLNIESKRYQPRQRYSFETANSTSQSDVIVTVDGNATTGGTDWVFDAGSRTTIPVNSLLSGNVSQSYTFTPIDVSDGESTTDAIAADNLTIINGSYPHIDVEINGVKLPETNEEALFTITSNASANTSTINFLDVGALPNAPIQPNSKIEIIERGTIDLEDTYQGDLPGSSMNIKVQANDALAAKLEQMRTFEIYPDAKGDATLLIDVDDAERLPVRPTDMAEKGLWPTTSSVSYLGIVDSKYNTLPNAGYVSRYNVQYQAFDIYDFENLFDVTQLDSATQLPKEGNVVHFAKGEHEEFDVYRLSNTSSNVSYIEYDEGKGTTFLWTDNSLSNVILDGNELSNTSADYDHTKWYDYVLALKGKYILDPYHKELQTVEGNPVYVTDQLEVDHPVTRFVSEEKVAESFVEMGNITHTVPDVKSIKSIVPQLSGNIISATPVAIQNATQFARANVITATSNISIARSVEADPNTQFVFNNRLTFDIGSGEIEGVQLGDYLKFADSGGSNLNANVFQVARIKPEGKVTLYANATVLNGMTSIIPKSTLSFINFGKNREANANVDYAVQVVAKGHEFREGDNVVFNVNNLGGSAGTEFTIKDSRTDNTFFLESARFGTNTALNVITDSATLSHANTKIKVTAVPNEMSTKGGSFPLGEHLQPGLSVKFIDTSGTELNGNSFIVDNVRREVTTVDQLTSATGVFANVTAPIIKTVESAVSNNTLVPVVDSTAIENNILTPVTPGMYMWTEDSIDPIEVKQVAFDLSNVGSEPVRIIRDANATANVITISNTDGISVGDKVLVSGVIDPSSNITVASISGSNITLSENITSVIGILSPPSGTPEGTTINNDDFTEFRITLANGISIRSNESLKFRHDGDGKVANVVLAEPVTLDMNSTVHFTRAQYEIPQLDGPEVTKEVIVFDIEPGTYTGGDLTEANLSYTINEGTEFSVDADLSSFPVGTKVKINAGGIYDSFTRTLKVTSNASANTFTTMQTKFEEPKQTYRVSANVSSNVTITVDQDTNTIAPGMQVEGTGIPTNTKIANIIGNTVFTVDNNVTITEGDDIKIYRTTFQDATFMSANTVITTREDHSFAIDGSDKLLGSNVQVYMMNPDYYNDTMKVVDIPTANTVVVDFPGFAHPYTTGGYTYLSRFDYEIYGTEAPGVTGNVDWTPFFVANHLGNIQLNNANVVTNAFPFHSVEQYLNDIADQMHTKAGMISSKGSFSIDIPYIDVGLNMNYNIMDTGSTSYPGFDAFPLFKGTQIYNPFDGTTNIAHHGPDLAKMQMDQAIRSHNEAMQMQQGMDQQRADMEAARQAQEQIVEPPIIVCPPQNVVEEPPKPTLTPQQIAAQALLAQMDFQAQYILPHQQEIVKPQAQYYVEAQGTQYDAAGGYSVGGPRNTGSGIEYGPGDQSYGSSEMVYNYETGEWESIPSGHKWTQGDVEYTMMSDGTIHGDNGTIWATTGTRISSNGMTGQLDGTYKDYGLTGLSETGSKKPDPQLKAKFALFNKDYTPGFGPNQTYPGGGAGSSFSMGTSANKKDPYLKIEHADADCTTLIPHEHDFLEISKQCVLDENGRNPEGIQHIKYQCQAHLNNAGNDSGCEYAASNGIYIEEHRGVASCTKPYGGYTSAQFSSSSVNEGASTVYTVRTDQHVEDGTKVTVNVSGSAGLADSDLGTTSSFVMTINNQKATKTINFTADATTEGAETLIFTLAEFDDANNPTGKRKATLTINDTSLDPVPTYNNITISKNTLNENGGTVELQVTGEHLTDGATVVATVSGSGITRSDFTAGSDLNSNLQMTFTMSDQGGNVFVSDKKFIAAIADVTTEGNEAMTITLAGADSNGASAGLPNSVSATIKDTSLTPVPPYECVDYYLYHNRGPDPETTSFLCTSDVSKTHKLKFHFDMYSANDGLKVYQSNTKYGTSRLLGGTHSGGGARNLTNQEKTEFKNVILSAQDSTGGTVKLTNMGSPDSKGGRPYAGVVEVDYNAGNGRYITVVTDRNTNGGSVVFRWWARVCVNTGDNPWYFEREGGHSGGHTDPSSAPTGSNYSGGAAVTTTSYAGVLGPFTGIAAIPNFGNVPMTPSSPIGVYTSLISHGYNNGGIYSQHGNGPGFGTKPAGVNVAGSHVRKKTFAPEPGFARGSIVATPNDFSNMDYKGTKPLDGRPSFQNQAGGFTDRADSPIPDNSAFNPESAPMKPRARKMILKLLKQTKTGAYVPFQGSNSPVQLDIPLEAYCIQPKVEFCATNSYTKDGSSTAGTANIDHSQYTIRGGDTFWVGNDQIDTTGITSATSMAERIRAQLGEKVNVNVVDKQDGSKCVRVAFRDRSSGVPILRNGCKGGILKEVLDFTVNNKEDRSYGETTVTAGSRTNTQTTTTYVNADTDSDANTADVEVGRVTTTATGTDFITNTITAEDRRGRDMPTVINVGHNGSGYATGDILRAVGGTAVSRQSTPGVQIAGLKLMSGGLGYGYFDKDLNRFVFDPSTIKITVGGPGSPGYGFVPDLSVLDVDPGTGRLVCPQDPIFGTDGNGNTMRGIPALPGLVGQEYVYNDPPNIVVSGTGTGAKFMVEYMQEPSNIEEVAVFEVTSVGDEGQIRALKILNRGLYETFPGDLNSGIPLEYHRTRLDSEGNPEAITTTPTRPAGAGKGGRVFMTARLIGDCREKGTALQDMGLQEGPVNPGDFDKHIVDYINDNTGIDRDGNPYFRGAIDNSGGIPKIRIGSDVGDGVELEGGRPGDLESFNIDPGAYIPEIPPHVDLVDGSPASGDGTGGTGGPDRGKGIRFSGRHPFAIAGDIGDYIVQNGLYKYELRRLDGNTPIQMTSESKAIHVDALALESVRHATETGLDMANIANVWIDNYAGTGKWAYLESNTIVRQQENLVNTRFIRDVFTYDNESAEKEFDIDLYDPFKGILPGFIDKEIDLKTLRDPIVYDGRKSKYGRKQVGLRWWDTTNVRYEWYEQGAGTYGSTGFNNYERSINWGNMFPGSQINIYEWVESLTPPSSYTKGTPHPNGKFITESHPDKTGKPLTHYYFWATELDEISDHARVNYGKERNTKDITRLLQNLDGERVAYTGIISPDALVVNTLSDLIRTEDSILSVNFKRKETEAVQKHSSWNLAGENDIDGAIPRNLSVKLIDSLAGYNAIKQQVPGTGLSLSERFGSKFRPRQTMFKDLKKARKQMFIIMNEIFRDLQMETAFIDWKDNLPTGYTLLQDTNWFEKQRVNKVDNSTIYYDNTFKPLRKVTDVKQFGLLENVLDKSIIQVQKNDSERYKLYEYDKKTNTFNLIAMEKETVKWSDRVYLDSQTLDGGMEIRNILVALYEKVFTNTYEIHWNKFFFEMLKYAYAEQGELDWAFKTTYLKVVKEETDLIPFKGFKVDNFDKAIEYFNEVKPYSSKIRNYSDIKKAPVEILTGSTSDFDRPPFYDEDNYSVRILDAGVSADNSILNSNREYAGFVSTSDKVRTFDQRIIFDRVKGDMYENTSGGSTQVTIADGTSSIFNLNFTVEDEGRLEVFVNGDKINKTSDSGNITNYTVDLDNSFVSFTDTANTNNRVGTPLNGDKVEFKYIDGFDPTLETMNVSIAKNLVAVESNSNINISNASMKWTAPERLWKFDPDVRTAITTAFDTAYGVGSGSNTEITTNVTIMTSMVADGNLKPALDLIKSKVHATFQGETLDANVFTDVVPGTHPTTFYTDTRGFDTYAWDDGLYDRETEVDNFVGIFSESASGNVNYRVNDETVYGFDSTTFLKHRYGPDRPEELAVVQPLETLTMDVYTKGNTQISTDSTDVRYLVFMDIFGQSEYYRRTINALTTVTANVNIWDNEISVADASKLPQASAEDTAVVWINGERIEYELRDTLNNKLKGITRGTKGTTPNTVLTVGQGIFNGEETENIRLRDANGNLLRDPEDFNWIKPVEIFDDTIPFDDDWDGSGSLTGFQNGVMTTAGIVGDLPYDADNANVTFGFDSSWDGSGSIKPTSNGVENYTLPSFDIDEDTGWDSGDKTLKEAGSLTDKGTVFKANTSIIDFLHNFD